MREGAKFYRMKAHIVRNRINLSWVGSVWAHASSFVGIGGFLLLAPSSKCIVVVLMLIGRFYFHVYIHF